MRKGVSFFLALRIVLLIPVLMLLCGQNSHAGEAENLALSNQEIREATRSIDRKEVKKSLPSLARAFHAARRLSDPYTRGNQWRYIGEQYWRAGKQQVAGKVWQATVENLLSVRPVDRRLSAAIGLVEMRKKQGDENGVRTTLQALFRQHLFQQVAASGNPGETNRLITNLDGVLGEAELHAFATVLKDIPDEAYRLRVLYKLATLEYAPGTDGKCDSLFPEASPSKETLLHLLLNTRYCTAEGDINSAKRFFERARILYETDPKTYEKYFPILQDLEKGC